MSGVLVGDQRAEIVRLSTALTAAKALADAVEEWAQPLSLCDPHVGEVARVRAEKLRAALAAFRAAGG